MKINYFGAVWKRLVVLLLFFIFAIAGATEAVYAQDGIVDLAITLEHEATGSGPYNTEGACPGTAHTPGDDCSKDDEYVRTLDTVIYKINFEVNVAGEIGQNTRVDMTLPTSADGTIYLAWDETSLNTWCPGGYTLSPDGLTATCNLGDYAGGSPGQIKPAVTVLGNAKEGENFAITATIEADNSSGAQTSDPVNTIVSAAPRLDVAKDRAVNLPIKADGIHPATGVMTDGLIYHFPVIVKISGGKGSEQVTDDLTFTDDFSGVSPNSRYYNGDTAIFPSGGGIAGCGPNYFASGRRDTYIPYGSIALGPASRPDRSVADSGTWTCVDNGDQTVGITIAGADTTGDHFAERAANNQLLGNDRYVVSGVISIWIPLTDVAAGNDGVVGTDDDGEITVINEYMDFDPNSVSGQSNFGEGLEPLANNDKQFVLKSYAGNFDKWYINAANNAVYAYVPGQSARESGDGVVMPGQTFAAVLNHNNVGALDLEGVRMCDLVDNNTQIVKDITAGDAVYTWSNQSGAAASMVIEYGDGAPDGLGGYTATAYQDNNGDGSYFDEHRTASCDTVKTGWYTNTSDVPGGAANITKVRVTVVDPLQPGRTVRAAIQFEALPGDDGTILPNHGKRQFPELNNGNWNQGSYNPNTALGSIGDRIKLTTAIVRVEKELLPDDSINQYRAGERITYFLNPFVIKPATIVEPPVARSVVLTDVLSSYVELVPNSFSYPPTSIIPDTPAVGQTTLVWNFGDVTPGDDTFPPDITFDVDISFDTPNNTNVENDALIYSPDDTSPDSERDAERDILAVNLASMSVFKDSLTPLEERNESMTFRLRYANTSADPLAALDLIDVLPYNGDGRIPASNFNGTLALNNVQVFNGETVVYSAAAPASINDNPDDPSNQPADASTGWCTQAEFGTGSCPDPANGVPVTAIRILGTDFASGAPSRQILVSLDATNNLEGDIYANGFTGTAAGLLKGVSNIVTSEVVASELGDRVWFDGGGDGIQNVGDLGIANVIVRLYNGDGTPADNPYSPGTPYTTTTSASGLYTFTNLHSGDYIVEFVRPTLADYTVQNNTAGPNGDADDSDITDKQPDFGRTSVIALGVNENNPTIDSGYTYPVLEKSIVATSEDHTAGTDVAIGEIVRYRLLIALAEGLTSEMVMRDNLPAGMQYIEGSAKAAIVSTNGTATLNSSNFPGSDPANADLYLIGDDTTIATITPSFTLPSSAIQSSPFASGDDVSFLFGVLTNADGDDDGEYVLVEMNVLVNNVATNQEATDLPNTYTVIGDGVEVATSLPVTVTVVEPSLSIEKSIVAAPADAGDEIVYDLVVTAADTANTATAYELVISDTLESQLELQSVIVRSEPAGTTSDTSASDAAGTVGGLAYVAMDQLQPGETATIRVTAIVITPTLNGDTIENLVDLTYTSLPEGGTPNNPTGSDPTDPNVGVDERDGEDGGPNDYSDSDDIDTTLDTPQIAKSLEATSLLEADGNTSGNNVTIGELITYTLEIVLPEGVTPDLLVTDTIGGGLAYVSHAVDVTNYSGDLTTAPTFANSSGVMTFDFGTVNTTAAMGTDQNTVTLRIVARVDDIPANVGTDTQSVINNAAELSYTDGTDGATVVDGGDVDVIVVEPAMTISKNIETPTANDLAGAGDVITITLEVANTGTSTAYDVIVTDPIPAAYFTNITSVSTPISYTFSTPSAAAGGVITATYSGGDLLVGETKTFVFTAEVTLAVTDTQVIDNIATVSQATTLPGNNPSERDELDVSDNDDITIVTPEIGVVKDDGITLINPDETTTYTIIVTNDGATSAPTITITDTIPVGTSFVSATAGGAETVAGSGVVVWTIPSGLGPNGASTTVDITIQVNQPYSGTDTLTNVVQVQDDGSKGTDGDPSDNTATDEDMVVLNSIGDIIWWDIDNSGTATPDAGEPGIEGVIVELTLPSGQVITTTTDADGGYIFEGLAPGAYVVTVDTSTLPPGMAATYDQDGNNDSSTPVTIPDDDVPTDVTDVDFSFTGIGSIGDTIWLDDNNDGVEDPEEVGIGGIVITLTLPIVLADGTTDTQVLTTTTAVDGTYSFPNLPAGDYTIEVDTSTLPSDVTQSGDPDGTLDDTHTYSLAPGENYEDADFGYNADASIGDRLWIDYDGDGVQDPNEPGIPGAVVELTLPDGQVITTTTDANGEYLFDNLYSSDFYGAGSTYTVAVDTTTIPADLSETFDLDGGLDSISEVTLAVGEDRRDVDFGYQGDSSLGDTVWFNQNGDGVLDPAEYGIPGVVISLTLPAGYVLPDGSNVITTTTDANGNYDFPNLPAGEYTVEVDTSTLPSGMDVNNSDLSGDNDSAETVTLGVSENRDDVDFGYAGDGQIGDTIWYDIDNSGTPTATVGEIPLEGIVVMLELPNGEVITTTTDANGTYLFENLYHEIYTVTVDTTTLPAGLIETYDSDGTATQSESTATLTPEEESDLDQDFSYTGTGAIGDYVWLDLNEDGVQDASEVGIPGVVITLTLPVVLADGTTDTRVLTTTTDNLGYYNFPDLPAGEYTVEIDTSTLPAGVSETFDTDGTGTPHIATVDLGAGETNNDVDFGYVGNSSLGDTIFYDINNDGIEGVDEPGIESVLITLTFSNGETVTTTTDANGFYEFTNLPAGDYTVTVDETTLPPGMTLSADPEGGDDSIASVTLGANEDNPTIDFGYTGVGSVGDYIWLDVNEDGIQDPTEVGITGVVITLTLPATMTASGNIEVITTTTDATGNYLFDNLPQGPYTIGVDTSTLPGGVTNTYDLDSGTLGSGGTPDGNTAFQLDMGEDKTDVDFGYVGQSSIGDTIFYDVNNDGVEATDDPGIEGVVVTLTFANGETITTTTDVNGSYLFDKLPEGIYRVTVDESTLPPGVSISADPDGPTDPNSGNSTNVVNLGPNEQIDTVDFGYTGDGSLGNYIWVDTNMDGIQGPNEVGIPGVVITLTLPSTLTNEPGDVTILTTTTDNLGYYNFPNLPAGSYDIEVDTSTLPSNTLSDNVVPTYDLDSGTGAPDSIAPGVTLGAGEDRDDVDFGYVGESTIGDTIWLDLNADGVQDPLEDGISDVVVTLTFANGEVVTTTTDANGNYLFTGLPGGDYVVTVDQSTLPNGIADITHDQDNGTAIPDAVTPVSVDGTVDGSRDDIDFGFNGEGLLGDRLWLDTNGDGVQDTGELGIPGVVISLTLPSGTVITTTTDASGNYLFTQLGAGDYTVQVDTNTLPDDVAQTYNLDGALNNATSVTLEQGESRLDLDFGYMGDSEIGDTIWHDLDGDGVQTPEEYGIKGVEVVLTFSNGQMITTTTDANGNYLFEGLPSDTYTVTVDPTTLPPALNQTGDPNGTSDITAMDHTSVVTLDNGDDNYDQDFGYQGEGSIGDTIWYDMNGDGVQDSSEYGVEGVVVALTLPSGTVITTTTDANGNYLFDGLPAGDYTIMVDSTTLPPEMVQTGDPDGVMDNMDAVTLAPAEDYRDGDFGYQPDGAIGDTVWFDLDGDGVQTPEEYGIAGVVVELTLPSGVVISTTTDANGNYLFPNLPAGDYVVTVDTTTLPAELTQTGDPDGLFDNMHPVSLGINEQYMDADFGYQGAGSIGDTVWNDLNGDGVQDPSEYGIEGVVVELTLPSGVVITTTTNMSGTYLFDGLPDGDYLIMVDTTTLPPNLVQTGDPDGVLDNTDTVSLAPAEEYRDGDFGYQGDGTIGDTIWFDLDGDGVQTPEEYGIAGVVVELTLPSGVVISTTTDANGNYLFTNLPAGDYVVTVDATTLPAELTQTGDPDDLFDNMYALSLGENEVYLDADFGYQGAGSIGDTVWHDLNGDGVQDPIEYGIEGVIVELTLPSGVVITTTTDATGSYTFNGLPDGAYTIMVDTTTLPPTFMQTGDPDGVMDNSENVSLAPGEAYTDGNFGYQSQSAIGDTIWFDLDGDGVQDVGEDGIAGVTVILTLPNGDVISTVTDANGNYLFGNLPPGDYVVTVDKTTLPPALTQTGDADGVFDHTHAVSLGDNELYLDADFGYQGAASIGDTIWSDSNGDGVQDVGESGLSGVVIELTLPSGTVITTTTDSNGNYIFAGLPAGDYLITVDADSLPGELLQTGDPDGVMDHTTAVSLAADEVYTDGDFGYQGDGSISNAIWLDLDGNGVQDPGEEGIPGVVVELTLPNGDVITTTTDSTGSFIFTNLPAGEYTLSVDAETLPPELTQTGDPDGLFDNLTSISLLQGEAFRGGSFGYQGDGSIGDSIWLDLNGDGVQDAGEEGLEGVVVELTLPSGNVITTTTDAGGNYFFEGLQTGNYVVTVVTDSLPANVIPTGDADGVFDHSTSISLGVDEENQATDFGYQPTTAIEGDVWIDENGDGIRDSNEVGIPDVFINLTTVMGEIFTTTTDANGYYIFTDLVPGDYTATVDPTTLPPNLVPSPNQDGELSSERDVILLPGDGVVESDFGYRPALATLSNYFWIDADQNGVKDEGEQPITGGIVILFDENGAEVARAITNDLGFFEFTVEPGRYAVEFIAPAGYEFTLNNVDAEFNSDVNPRTGRTEMITLLPNENVSDAGAGIYQLTPTAVTLSNFVMSLEEDEDGPQIVIRWTTTAEFNTLGYHLLRGINNDFTTARQVTTELIQADGGSNGNSYESSFAYDPATDPPLSEISIWLSELEYGGLLSIYGPAPTLEIVLSAQHGVSIYLPIIE